MNYNMLIFQSRISKLTRCSHGAWKWWKSNWTEISRGSDPRGWEILCEIEAERKDEYSKFILIVFKLSVVTKTDSHALQTKFIRICVFIFICISFAVHFCQFLNFFVTYWHFVQRMHISAVHDLRYCFSHLSLLEINSLNYPSRS